MLTSASETLWSYFHTARIRNESRPGTKQVNGNSQYRIASITKAFTTLAVLRLHAAGKLDINDPVDKYISELAGQHKGNLPWKDITLRALASQLSGIPREFGQSDILALFSEPWRFGLPPMSEDTLPPCTRQSSANPCNASELLHYVKTYEPIFAPNQQSTYSNLNFELLGIVIENVTGQTYEEHIDTTIFKPLNMSFSTLTKPSDENAVIGNGENDWDDEMGALAPTGGIYSSALDLSKFLRFALTHYNALVTGVNWFQPASFAGLQGAYGMPWEVYRSANILHESKRPVTLVTKAGGVPGYFSIIAAIPEYNLGITILVAGAHELLTNLIELVTKEIVRAAESAVWSSIKGKYTGTFVSMQAGLNSSVVISTSPARGIVLERFISNGTDVVPYLSLPLKEGIGERAWHLQLIPTLLFKNESSQQGEIFRVVFTPERNSSLPDLVWDAFCLTDIDTPGTYAGLPLNELVFWHERGEVELSAFRVVLTRQGHDGELADTSLLVQLPGRG